MSETTGIGWSVSILSEGVGVEERSVAVELEQGPVLGLVRVAAVSMLTRMRRGPGGPRPC